MRLCSSVGTIGKNAKEAVTIDGIFLFNLIIHHRLVPSA